jgi:hypothetical protein
MLETARQERRRADGEAATSRDRLDAAADARRASVLAEVKTLERRRAALRRQVRAMQDSVPADPPGRLDVRIARLRARLRWHRRVLRTH